MAFSPFVAIRKTTLIPVIVIGLFVVAGLVAAAAPSAKSPYFKESTTKKLGRYLTDANGMTLYTYGNDKPGSSRCRGACGDRWPAYGPDANDRSSKSLAKLPVNVGVISNSDGQMQFTWKGLPIYRCSKDKTKGEALGMDNFWRIIKP